jgi:hypothetical protein
MNAGRHGWMAIAALLALASCAVELEGGRPDDEASEASDEADKIGGDDGDGMQTQGRFLLGEGFDARGGRDRHFAVTTTATAASGDSFVARVVGTDLLVSPAGMPWLVVDPTRLGLVFPGIDGGALRLGAPTQARDGLVTYRIEVQSKPNGRWDDVCAGTTAVPVHGTFGRDGLHHDEDAITFGCHVSAISKCVRWGYPPIDGPGGPLWDHFQACTRMTRFDVCSDGTSHTMDGTHIAFRDQIEATSTPAPPDHFTSPTTWPPPVEVFYYEAAWRGDDRPARCLARGRWDHLALGGPCDDKLPDPRLHPEAQSCEDLLDDVEGEDDVLVFSASRYGDLAMHRWEIGDDLISTIMGHYYAPESGKPAEVPFEGDTIRYHGIDGLLLRTRPDSIDEHDLVAVHLWKSIGNDDRVVTTEAARPPGHSHEASQGYIFLEPQEGTTPLYQHRRGGRYVTSTLASISGYQREPDPVGHVYATPGTSE